MNCDTCQRRLPLLRLLAGGLLLCGAAPAFAGALYRCSGKNGELAYTNRTGGYSNCVKVASYADEPAKAAAETVARGSAGLPAGRWNYRENPESTVEATAKTSDDPAEESGKAPENTKVLRGAVYKVSKANGVVEYTNIRPAGRYQVLFTYMATCFACDVRSRVDFGTVALNLTAFKDEIAQAAKDFELDEALLRALIHAESAFNPNALSVKGAQGLMQLMPGTANDLGVADPFDAAQNIRGGAQYLAGLLKNFEGDERLALAAYNAGPASVQKYGGVPPFDETQVYVDRVGTLHDRYRKGN